MGLRHQVGSDLERRINVGMLTWHTSASTGGLAAGGTGGFIAVYIVSSFVYFTVVLSLAEMSSIAPTAGTSSDSRPLRQFSAQL